MLYYEQVYENVHRGEPREAKAHRLGGWPWFSLPSSFLAGDAAAIAEEVPPSCVVPRYYRIILGYFT